MWLCERFWVRIGDCCAIAGPLFLKQHYLDWILGFWNTASCSLSQIIACYLHSIMQSNVLQQACVIASFDGTMPTQKQSPAVAATFPLIQQRNICLPPDFSWAIMFHVSQLKYLQMHTGEHWTQFVGKRSSGEAVQRDRIKGVFFVSFPKSHSTRLGGFVLKEMNEGSQWKVRKRRLAGTLFCHVTICSCFCNDFFQLCTMSQGFQTHILPAAPLFNVHTTCPLPLDLLGTFQREYRWFSSICVCQPHNPIHP